jgi:outer membrane lipoprotein SlyB
MKQKCLRVLVATPLLAAISLSAQSFGGARLIQSAEPIQPQHQYIQQAAYQPSPVPQRRRVRRRSKKKSAVIIGGSALGGAAVGGLVGGKKGALIGAGAGAGAGYIYDRKTQKKPIIPQ